MRSIGITSMNIVVLQFWEISNTFCTYSHIFYSRETDGLNSTLKTCYVRSCEWQYQSMYGVNCPCPFIWKQSFCRTKQHCITHTMFVIEYIHPMGTAVAQWLRCCATKRKVVGSIPDGVNEIFHWHNPSDRTMALGSTQPLTEMSTRRISWG